MDQHEAHAEAIRSNNLLLKGTYEDGYKAGFKAGREAGMREAAIDADAATRYGKTAQAHGFSNAPPWSELAEETKQLYRYAILAAIGGGK